MDKVRTAQKRLAWLVLAASLTMAAPLQSQETATPEPTQTESAAPAAEASTTADATAETFKDWVVRCMTRPDSGRLCEMTQELKDANSGQRVLAIALKPSATTAGGANVTIVAPLGLKLAPGLTLKADSSEPIALPYDTCLPGGCIIRAELSSAQLATLPGATEISADMTAPDSTILGVKLSPSGFTEAWKRLEELRK